MYLFDFKLRQVIVRRRRWGVRGGTIRALLTLNPAGVFHEHVETEVIIAPRERG